MHSINFKQIDVFTSTPFKGNPVAVVMNADQLSTAQMQAIANWTNLSETTFVLPATNDAADYRVRIFTPGSELPFAGHPTLGTAFALLEAGQIIPRDGHLVQECGAGLVNLQVSQPLKKGMSIAFELPEPVITPLSFAQTRHLGEILGCQFDFIYPPALVDVGARWIVAQTTDIATVLATRPDFASLAEHDRSMSVTGVCIYGSCIENNKFHIEVRSFAPSCGVNEDPVCGSGNGSVAAFLRYHGLGDGLITSTQGKIAGRDGKLELRLTDGKIFVGGQAVTCISGSINLDNIESLN